MSLIDVTDLTFAYDGSFDNVFENVSFQIDTNWKLGLIGRNGRGKTTLLCILRGKLEYRGRISADVAFDYFPFAIEDRSLPTRSIADGINPDLEGWQLERELNLLEVGLDVMDRPFSTLSNGEQTKVMLAILFTRENRFLLIDEPTNHLDLAARDLTGRYLKSKKGFILVSHDRHFLDDCIDHVMAFNRTGIEIQRGNFSSWWINRQRQDAYERARDSQLKSEIDHLKTAAELSARRAQSFERQKIGASDIGKSIGRRPYMGEKSRKVMKQSKNFQRRQNEAAAEKTNLLKDVETTFPLKLSPLQHHARRLVLMADVSISYGGREVLNGFDMIIERGDRVALRGRNGSGKSSLISLLLHPETARSGRVLLAGGLVISHVPQDASFLRGSLSQYARDCRIDERLFRAILNKLDFNKEQMEKDMWEFSDGQRKKVLIARSLSEQAHLYVWDEPLNFIDIFSRLQIEDLLLTCQPTLLFVEHDAAFVDRIATRTINLS